MTGWHYGGYLYRITVARMGQEGWLLQVNLQKASESIVFWDSVPQTSVYSNSNSAVVEPPGGGCNILTRSQVLCHYFHNHH